MCVRDYPQLALQQGLGMMTLPCFVGDADPLLVRVPGTDLHMHGTLVMASRENRMAALRIDF